MVLTLLQVAAHSTWHPWLRRQIMSDRMSRTCCPRQTLSEDMVNCTLVTGFITYRQLLPPIINTLDTHCPVSLTYGRATCCWASHQTTDQQPVPRPLPGISRVTFLHPEVSLIAIYYGRMNLFTGLARLRSRLTDCPYLKSCAGQCASYLLLM